MNLNVIRRRSVWSDEKELKAVNDISARVGKEMADRLRWIRSYAVKEPDGRLGSVCIYEASNPEAIWEHGERIGVPSDEVQIVIGTAVVRDDPQPNQTD